MPVWCLPMSIPSRSNYFVLEKAKMQVDRNGRLFYIRSMDGDRQRTLRQLIQDLSNLLMEALKRNPELRRRYPHRGWELTDFDQHFLKILRIRLGE